jgi:hypothetical protein
MSVFTRITKSNFVPSGPKFRVYDYWYNILVDALNSYADTGIIRTNVFSELPSLYLPSTHYKFFDDFDRGAASGAINADWTVYETDAGNTEVLTDAVGGIMTLTNGATDDDSASQVVLANESFRLVVGKKLWFETRIRSVAADVTNLDLSIGLIETEDLSTVADNKPANGIVFIKTDAGVGTIFLNSSDNNTDIVSAAAVHTLVTNTWTRLGFYFDGGATGSATITPYINGVAGSPLTSITYATMAELAPSFKVGNGDAVTTQVLQIDYVLVVQER